jgi:predicted Zn-dependent peptidase
MLEAKLPASLALPDAGWRRAYGEDPLGIFGGRVEGALGAKGRDAAIDKQLGFLDAPAPVQAMRSFALPNGITVRVRRDQGAHRAAITVRIATIGDPVYDGGSAPKPLVYDGGSAPKPLVYDGGSAPKPLVYDGGSAPKPPGEVPRSSLHDAAGETVHTITVDRADVDAGIELGAARLRLALGDTVSAELAEIRSRAGGARRKILQQTPYGPGWLALGEALFPPDHPLSGTVLGAGEEAAALRDMMIAEAMRRERALARGSITVVGDVDELRAKKIAEAFLAPVSTPSDPPVALHPREDRLTVEDDVPSPRALLGWIGPGEGEAGDASLRVAFEILESPHVALLGHALVDRGVCSAAHAALELGPRAGVATIELMPAPGRDLAEGLRALDAEIDRLAREGPDAGQVAVARFFLHARLQKERAAAEASGIAGAVHSASLAKLRHALWPHAIEQAQKALDEVTVASVRTVVRRFLAREHRVVVTTLPRVR